MDELKLSATAAGYPPPDEVTDKDRVKKKRGCGCFLMGCFALIVLMSLPPIGFLVYLGTLSDADYGGYVVTLLKNPDVAKGVKESIEESPDLTPEQKAAVTQAYDALLTKYDKLPADKQDAVKRNIVAVVKKAVADPEGFAAEPPPELLDIFVTLDIGASFSIEPPATDDADVPPPPTSATTPPAPPQAQTQPPKSQDPYSFDLPSAPDTQAKDEVESSQYDF